MTTMNRMVCGVAFVAALCQSGAWSFAGEDCCYPRGYAGLRGYPGEAYERTLQRQREFDAYQQQQETARMVERTFQEQEFYAARAQVDSMFARLETTRARSFGASERGAFLNFAALDSLFALAKAVVSQLRPNDPQQPQALQTLTAIKNALAEANAAMAGGALAPQPQPQVQPQPQPQGDSHAQLLAALKSQTALLGQIAEDREKRKEQDQQIVQQLQKLSQQVDKLSQSFQSTGDSP